MVGNTIVLKPASATMQCGIEIEKTFEKAGFPNAVFQTLVGDSSIADTFIDSDINAVTFTGQRTGGNRWSNAWPCFFFFSADRIALLASEHGDQLPLLRALPGLARSARVRARGRRLPRSAPPLLGDSTGASSTPVGAPAAGSPAEFVPALKR